MRIHYQIIIIGANNSFVPAILEIFFRHLKELGVSKDSTSIINSKNFRRAYKPKAPSYCLYFGRKGAIFPDLEILDMLLKNACYILPIVRELKYFTKSTPLLLHSINGIQLKTKMDIEPLISNLMEGLSLLRVTRRLFISYKRTESSMIAIQLFNQFAKRGFDVFLDTHSIRPGDTFQDELWHRLADTDVVVLLNTPRLLESKWTKEELARASSMSIGIFQILWPTQKLERDAKLSLPFQLIWSDFGTAAYTKPRYLIQNTISKIVSSVESLRARSLAARQTNIVTEFVRISSKHKIPVRVQPTKFIVIKRKDGKELVIIPTIGIPQALTYHQSEELVKKIKSRNVAGTYLLYDHVNIREMWLSHLDWLDTQLRVKSIKIFEASKKIKKLVNETKTTK